MPQDGPVRLGHHMEVPEAPTQAQEREAKAADVAATVAMCEKVIAFCEQCLKELPEPGGEGIRGFRSTFGAWIGRMRDEIYRIQRP